MEILRELLLISILLSLIGYLEAGTTPAAVDIHVSPTVHGYNARIQTATESHTLSLKRPTGKKTFALLIAISEHYYCNSYVCMHLYRFGFGL